MKQNHIFKSFKKQKGMSVAIIIASIVVLGVLGYIGSSIFTAIVGGNQRANLVIQSGQNLTQASFTLTTEATKNASGVPVAVAFEAGSPAPTGGGIIPASSAAPKTDSFGTNLGYCTNNAVAQNDPVFAIISAGSNRTFDTTCAEALVGTKIDDDKVLVKSVGNVLQGVGGTVYFGDPVAAVTDLANLSAVKPGQLRTVLADGSAWVNKTGAAGASNWTQVGAASGGATIPPLSCMASDSTAGTVSSSIGVPAGGDTVYQWKTVGTLSSNTWIGYTANTALPGAKMPPSNTYYGTTTGCTNPTYPKRMERRTMRCSVSGTGIVTLSSIATTVFCFDDSNYTFTFQ